MSGQSRVVKQGTAAMGNSEWGLLVRSQQDMDTVEQLVDDHNDLDWDDDDRGEDLRVNSVLRFRGHLFVCLGSFGGRDYTSRFLEKHTPESMVIFWPFAKPVGWYECDEEVPWPEARDSLPPTAATTPNSGPAATTPIPGLEPCSPLPPAASTTPIPGLGPCNVQRWFP